MPGEPTHDAQPRPPVMRVRISGQPRPPHGQLGRNPLTEGGLNRPYADVGINALDELRVCFEAGRAALLLGDREATVAEDGTIC